MFNANKWFEPIDSLAVDPDKARHQLVEAARLGYDYAKNIIVMKKQNAQQFQLRPDLSAYKFDAAMFSNPYDDCDEIYAQLIPKASESRDGGYLQSANDVR